MVARLGGDEFVVVINDMVRTTDALAAAERVRTALAKPMQLGTDSTVVSASVGIAVAHGSETPADLLRDADTAMYRAKEQGRDRAELFEVHLQQVVRLSDGAVTGAEALARIRS